MEDLLDINADDDTNANGDQEMQDIKSNGNAKHDFGNDDNDHVEINTTVPKQCCEALATALAAQKNWQRRWHTETTDGARGKLKMGFVGVPV